MAKSPASSWALSNSWSSFFRWGIVSLAFVGGLVILYFANESLYIRLGIEDDIGENLSALFHALAGILLLIVGYRNYKQSASLKSAIFAILFGLFFIFIAGEEISWGQRILGFSTPEAVSKLNYQDEFTLHNIDWPGFLASLLDAHRVHNVFMALIGLVIPTLYLSSRRIRKLANEWSFPVVPLALVPLFVLGLMYGQTITKIVPHYTHTEVKELVFSVSVLLFGISVYQGRNKLE